MPGRRNPPLFDMLRSDGAARVPIAPLRPSAGPVEVKVPRADASAPEAASPTRSRGGGHLRVPIYGLYIAITVALAAVILTWAVGFQIGKRRGEEAALKQLGVGPSPVVKRTDPTNTPSGAGPSTPEKPQSNLPRENPPVERVERPVPSGAIIGARGEVVEEPRQTGTNYLKLASRLSADEAQAAAAFLGENGVQAIGVRVDGTGSGANNPSRYDLYSLFGVPSSRYSQMEAERGQHWQLVQRLGRDWQLKHKGTVNFASPQWVLFRG